MDFLEQPTETALKLWRFGSTQSERLCASILHSEGFSRVDPQCPLGGPDGLKDVLFELNGWRYIAACYFPTKEKEFKDVKEKFEDDFKGVKQNDAKGIAFFTNQHITPGEREILEEIASTSSSSARIYHVEAIRAILDSPRGYGMRLEFLRIPMKPEEQASFISQFGSDLSAAMDRNSVALYSMAKKVSEIHAAIVTKSAKPLARLPARIAATIATRTMATEMIEASDKTKIKAKTSFITKNLDRDLLCYIHRSMMDDEPSDRQAGALRNVGVWVGTPGSTPEHARYVAPKPEDVPQLVEAMLTSWCQAYDSLLGSDRPTKIRNIAKFHHELLRIHPFVDGNGRLARLIMEQQARELLEIDRHVVIADSTAYFEALQNAHSGNLVPLEQIIAQALLGTLNNEG